MAKLKATATPAMPQRLHVWTEPTPSFRPESTLGQPVFSSSAPCPLCEQTMDPLGDHPLRLPYSRSSTFVQPCRVVWLSPFSLEQCARTESFHFVSTLTRAVNVLASGKAPYVPSAFPCRWSVDRSGKAEPRCPASLLRRSTSETSREMFLLGWQGGDLPRV